MIGLLTAFVLVHGDASLWWWVLWAVLEVGELMKAVK